MKMPLLVIILLSALSGATPVLAKEPKVEKDNLFAKIPAQIPEEIFETIHKSENVKIERIVSKGQNSPKDFWYDQTENEWVIVLKGRAGLRLEGKEVIKLGAGDYVNIPAHAKHRVEWTDKKSETIWLAVFY